MALYVAVEGLIGAGKSTVAGAMAERSHGRMFGEPVEENPFLRRFYAGEVHAALPMQLQFLLTRYAQQLQIQELRSGNQMLVSDYAFGKELVFAAVLLRDRQERELHMCAYSLLGRRANPPDVLVFLDASVDECLERIRQRGRAIEHGVDAAYLAALSASYAKWLDSYAGRVIRVAPPRFRPDSDDAVRFASELISQVG